MVRRGRSEVRCLTFVIKGGVAIVGTSCRSAAGLSILSGALTIGLALPGYTLIVDEAGAADLYAALVNKVVGNCPTSTV